MQLKQWCVELDKAYPQNGVKRALDHFFPRMAFIARKSKQEMEQCAGVFVVTKFDCHMSIDANKVFNPSIHFEELPFYLRELYRASMTPGVASVIGFSKPNASVVKHYKSEDDLMADLEKLA